MLNAEQRTLELDIYQVFSDVGTSHITLLRNLNSNGHAYTENTPSFIEIPLVGSVDLQEVSDAQFMQESGIRAVFTIPSKSLRDNGLLSNIYSNITTNDRISFGGITYKVENVVPNTLIFEIFLTYRIECR